MVCQYCHQSSSTSSVLGFDLCKKCITQLKVSKNTTSSNKGVIYCRVSTKKQSEDPNTGMFIQIRTCIEYCCSNNIKCSGLYTDVHSGFNMTNSGLRGLRHMFTDLGYEVFVPRWFKTGKLPFKNVVNAIKDSRQLLLIPKNPKHIQMVVVANVDRFGRDIQNMLSIRNQLKAHGTHIVSASQSFTTEESLGDLQFVKQSLDAEAFSREKSIRIKNVKKCQRELGHYLGGVPPFGKKIIHTNGIRKLADDAHEQSIIQTIDKLYSQQGMTPRLIARTLNNKGQLKRGRKWVSTQVMYIVGKSRVPDIGQLSIDDSDSESETESETESKTESESRTFDDDMDTAAN